MHNASYINTHCHLLNYDFIPDSYFKVRSPLKESILKRRSTAWIVKTFFALIPGRQYDRLHEVFGIMKQPIEKVADILVAEMRAAGLLMCTPLMMDLEFGSLNVKPEVPYRYQILKISDIARKYAGIIMPFVMLDPRRRSVVELIKTAVNDLGFLGVKMYPSLGYHPDPASFFNAAAVNQNLRDIYEFCQKEQIPISVHCSHGGSYSGDLVATPELIEKFAKPHSWQGVLQTYPNLRLNFSHFGGNLLHLAEKKVTWPSTIAEYIRDFPNVYTDISYHEQALSPKSAKGYFQLLQGLLADPQKRPFILFGTDWPATRHTWQEKDYLQNYLDNLSAPDIDQIAIKNPLRFLFPAGILPARITSFYERNGVNWQELKLTRLLQEHNVAYEK